MQFIYLNKIKIKLFGFYLSENPNAIHYLEKNKDKINWFYLSVNPNIFELDYIIISEKK
jgi:hypothetical protein